MTDDDVRRVQRIVALLKGRFPNLGVEETIGLAMAIYVAATERADG